MLKVKLRLESNSNSRASSSDNERSSGPHEINPEDPDLPNSGSNQQNLDTSRHRLNSFKFFENGLS